MSVSSEEYANFLLDVMFNKTDTISNFAEVLKSTGDQDKLVAETFWYCMDKAWALGYDHGHINGERFTSREWPGPIKKGVKDE